jgi:hypothetical protein
MEIHLVLDVCCLVMFESVSLTSKQNSTEASSIASSWMFMYPLNLLMDPSM